MTTETIKQDKTASGARWYVAQTISAREAYAVENLRNQGFACFLPMFEKTVRHARKLTNVRRALFPGYIFISFDVTRDRWRSVNGTRGVSRLIMAQNAPLPAPKNFVQELQAHIDARGLFQLDRGVKVGARIEVITGPLAEHFGEILSLDDRGRARVLIEMMNGKIAVQLERAALSAVASAA